MRIRPTKIILLILLAFSSSYTVAESPEKLLGKPYTYASVSKYIQNLKNDKPVESFLPYLRILKLDYLKSGVSMELNTDIVLSKFHYLIVAIPTKNMLEKCLLTSLGG